MYWTQQWLFLRPSWQSFQSEFSLTWSLWCRLPSSPQNFLCFWLACYLYLIIFWLWVNHTLVNIFITSSFFCIRNIPEKSRFFKSSLNESEEFGDAIQTVTLKSRILLEPSLLFSHYVYIFIIEFTVLCSNYVHLSLYPTWLKSLWVETMFYLFLFFQPCPIPGP